MKRRSVIVGALLLGAIAAHAGNFDLKGVFMVSDQSGLPLGNVDVSYRINDGGWKSCGTSQTKSMELGAGYIKRGKEVNFVQYQPCFPGGRETVSWRFRKAGYREVEVSDRMPSYRKGTGADHEVFKKITMLKLPDEHKSSTSSSSRSSNRSGFYCIDVNAG